MDLKCKLQCLQLKVAENTKDECDAKTEEKYAEHRNTNWHSEHQPLRSHQRTGSSNFFRIFLWLDFVRKRILTCVRKQYYDDWVSLTLTMDEQQSVEHRLNLQKMWSEIVKTHHPSPILQTVNTQTHTLKASKRTNNGRMMLNCLPAFWRRSPSFVSLPLQMFMFQVIAM